MSDIKDAYSDTPVEYCEEIEPAMGCSQLLHECDKSLERKRRYGSNWFSLAVNLNELVERYAPDSVGVRWNIKYVFRGERYSVIVDMLNGSVRVWDAHCRLYVDMSGGATRDPCNTHFMIKAQKGECDVF